MLLWLFACLDVPKDDEICDSGVDDDGDGRVDLEDTACGDDDSLGMTPAEAIPTADPLPLPPDEFAPEVDPA